MEGEAHEQADLEVDATEQAGEEEQCLRIRPLSGGGGGSDGCCLDGGGEGCCLNLFIAASRVVLAIASFSKLALMAMLETLLLLPLLRFGELGLAADPNSARSMMGSGGHRGWSMKGAAVRLAPNRTALADQPATPAAARVGKSVPQHYTWYLSLYLLTTNESSFRW